MRLALISDIHGNDVAFAAVTADIDRLGLDGCVCLGDVAQGGAQPAESITRLRALGARVAMGNSDHFLLEIPTNSPELITAVQLEVREWTCGRLGAEALDYIATFEPIVSTTVAPATRVVAFHGSPRSFDDVLLPWSEDDALVPFQDVEADLVTGGHTHIQWSRRLGNALFVNPGSVGLAYDHHQPEDDFRLTPTAEYAIVTGGRSEPSVEFRRIPYSLAELLAMIRASGRPHAESFAQQWRGAG
jgi:predicted phosphodiesterase